MDIISLMVSNCELAVQMTPVYYNDYHLHCCISGFEWHFLILIFLLNQQDFVTCDRNPPLVRVEIICVAIV